MDENSLFAGLRERFPTDDSTYAHRSMGLTHPLTDTQLKRFVRAKFRFVSGMEPRQALARLTEMARLFAAEVSTLENISHVKVKLHAEKLNTDEKQNDEPENFNLPHTYSPHPEIRCTPFVSSCFLPWLGCTFRNGAQVIQYVPNKDNGSRNVCESLCELHALQSAVHVLDALYPATDFVLLVDMSHVTWRHLWGVSSSSSPSSSSAQQTKPHKGKVSTATHTITSCSGESQPCVFSTQEVNGLEHSDVNQSSKPRRRQDEISSTNRKTEIPRDYIGISKRGISQEDKGMSKREIPQEDKGISKREISQEHKGISKTEFPEEDKGISKREISQASTGYSKREIRNGCSLNALSSLPALWTRALELLCAHWACNLTKVLCYHVGMATSVYLRFLLDHPRVEVLRYAQLRGLLRKEMGEVGFERAEEYLDFAGLAAEKWEVEKRASEEQKKEQEEEEKEQKGSKLTRGDKKTEEKSGENRQPVRRVSKQRVGRREEGGGQANSDFRNDFMENREGQSRSVPGAMTGLSSYNNGGIPLGNGRCGGEGESNPYPHEKNPGPLLPNPFLPHVLDTDMDASFDPSDLRSGMRFSNPEIPPLRKHSSRLSLYGTLGGTGAHSMGDPPLLANTHLPMPCQAACPGPEEARSPQEGLEAGTAPLQAEGISYSEADCGSNKNDRSAIEDAGKHSKGLVRSESQVDT